MSVTTSNGYWFGSAAEDIADFLDSYASDGFEIHKFRLASCSCGSKSFELFADDEEGVAKRICSACRSEHFICDSQQYWDEAKPEKCVCAECKNETCNVGVGFSLYEDESAIKWLYVGVRCDRCTILGCFAGWKIGYEPSLQMMDTE